MQVTFDFLFLKTRNARAWIKTGIESEKVTINMKRNQLTNWHLKMSRLHLHVEKS